jgi:hypothetical protein
MVILNSITIQEKHKAVKENGNSNWPEDLMECLKSFINYFLQGQRTRKTRDLHIGNYDVCRLR